MSQLWPALASQNGSSKDKSLEEVALDSDSGMEEEGRGGEGDGQFSQRMYLSPGSSQGERRGNGVLPLLPVYVPLPPFGPAPGSG